MKKQLIATTTAALIAAALYTAYDYTQPDATAIKPAPGVTAEQLLQVDLVSSVHGTTPGKNKVKTSHSVRPGGPPSRPKR